MTFRLRPPAAGLAAVVTAMLAALLAAPGAAAQDQIVKLGVTEYTTHSRTNGVTGIGVPDGADARTGNATTLLLTYERLLRPDLGIELAVGLPPRIHARATGTVAFLGDDVLSARNVAPTLFLNYHLGVPGDRWRPYLGAGVNFTRFTGIRSSLAPRVAMGDSTGWAVQAGVDYAIDRRWGLFGSVAALRVRSKLVATGSTVLQTTIDFRPVVYSFGAAVRF